MRLKALENIESILRPFSQLPGQAGIYYEDLLTGETAGFGEHSPMIAASLIKLPVLMMAMEMAEEGKLNLNERIRAGSIAKYPSCGVVAYMHPESVITLQDLCTFMITVSDNTAANWLIERIGTEAVNAYMQRQGCRYSALRRRLFDSEAARQGLQNHVTAYDMALLLRRIYRSEVPGAAAMLQILQNQQLNGKIPVGLRGLAAEEDCAHKTGEDDDITHDVGIVLGEKPFIICFMTNRCPDTAAAEYAMHSIVRQLMQMRQ